VSEAVDDVMDEEDEEEEGDKILKQVLDEIGVDLSQQVRPLLVSLLLLLLIRYQLLKEAPTGIATTTSLLVNKQPLAVALALATLPPKSLTSCASLLISFSASSLSFRS
jgi:charged multivesicular body protein 2A